MAWIKNATNLPNGDIRSLNGAADEQIFIGRATKAGFYLFFKVWRDMPYDAVLEYGGILYRIEVKGTSTDSINVTRGSRAGQQINRNVNRTRIINRSDCDFVVGVDGRTGDCYIVPVDVIEIMDMQNLTLAFLNPFKEKWDLFKGGRLNVPDITKNGLQNKSVNEINRIINRLGTVPPGIPYRQTGTKKIINDLRSAKILHIWAELGS